MTAYSMAVESQLTAFLNRSGESGLDHALIAGRPTFTAGFGDVRDSVDSSITTNAPRDGITSLDENVRSTDGTLRGWLRHYRVLICDRDRKWSGERQRLLDEAGLLVVQTPLQAPNANAYAERFVRSIKEECLDRMIPIGECHLRQAATEIVDHYHRERHHQGIGNELIEGESPRREGRVRRRLRLGGLLNYYERAA